MKYEVQYFSVAMNKMQCTNLSKSEHKQAIHTIYTNVGGHIVYEQTR